MLTTVLLHLIVWPLAALWLLALVGRLLWRPDPSVQLEPAGLEPDPGSELQVSVVVPARNEADNIEGCLTALLAQDLPGLQVIVVDDRSTDGTGELAAQVGGGRIQLLQGTEPPSGWAGKPAACQRGADQATGSWLLFLDADVRLAPWAIRRALAVARARRLDLLSLWGTWTLITAWEQILLPAVGGFIRLAQPLDRINTPGRPEAFANGQFLLFRTEAYRRLGGHGRVRGEVLEDVALGRAIKQEGLRLGMLHAPGAFAVRLYRGFREIWQGFSKNMYAGMGHRPAVALAALLLVGGLHLGPLAVLAGSGLTGSWIPLCGAAFSLFAQLLTRVLEDRAAGRQPTWALTQPLAQLILCGIILNSALRHQLGWSVAWKGRPVRP